MLTFVFLSDANTSCIHHFFAQCNLVIEWNGRNLGENGDDKESNKLIVSIYR